MVVRRVRRVAVRRTRRHAYRPRHSRRVYRSYRRFRHRRFGRKQYALQRAGNFVRYTTKNNVNLILVWPVTGTPPSAGSSISATRVTLTIRRIISGNRQFDRNLKDYAWIKFNYVAVKVTDLCHIPYDQVNVVKNDQGQAAFIYTPGVNALCGSVPINVNWDVEQDFEFSKGHEGVVNPEGFAQYPGTKTFKPGQRKPVSFVWRFPKPWRQLLSTDTVKNNMGNDDTIAESMFQWTGIKNIRAPRSFWMSIPEFWGNLLPNQVENGAAIRTYIRLMVYMGVTFRGRRIMDDNTCTPTSCSLLAENVQTME